MIVVRERGGAEPLPSWPGFTWRLITPPHRPPQQQLMAQKTPESKCHLDNFTACFIITWCVQFYTLFILNLIFSKTRVTEIIFLHPYILKPVFGQNTELTILRNGPIRGQYCEIWPIRGHRMITQMVRDAGRAQQQRACTHAALWRPCLLQGYSYRISELLLAHWQDVGTFMQT